MPGLQVGGVSQLALLPGRGQRATPDGYLPLASKLRESSRISEIATRPIEARLPHQVKKQSRYASFGEIAPSKIPGGTRTPDWMRLFELTMAPRATTTLHPN